MTRNKYALVSLDVKSSDVDRLFYYSVPAELEKVCAVGMRVFVPLGVSNKEVLGYIVMLRNESPPENEVAADKIKPIYSLPDDFPVLAGGNLDLAKWMQKKYYTTLSRCIRSIVPSSKPDGSFPKSRASAKSATPLTSPPPLTTQQSEAYKKIEAVLKDRLSTPILLHGVTGSGKTELYFRAIETALASGLDAILLVPEIALAPQMVKLFYARFGELVAVTHSRLTGGERFVIWKKALDGEVKIVIGPRSAIFMPFANLGLIVIDEEHVDSYHSETTPKYDAREVAIKRAQDSRAGVLLGSATPSLESYTKAVNSEYFLVKLTARIGKTLPSVCIVDMRQELTKGNVSMFSARLIEALGIAIESGKQALLFLNRRGYSTFVSCRQCGLVLSCDACRVNYTYHAKNNRLLCHYCGRGMGMPSVCPACNSLHIKRSGIGTQKVEVELLKYFPDAKILRMDMDTTKGKHGHKKILDAFRKGCASILVGTQMVTKGLDFPQVTVVGVLAADMSLYTGDFRSSEYTYQLLTQVAGRAGRAIDPGFVYVQTYSPDHYAIKMATESSYESFYNYESKLRYANDYPPYTNVFSVMLTGPVEIDVINALRKLVAIMEYTSEKDRAKSGGKTRFEIMGMSPAFVSKINLVFRWKVLLKCKDENALTSFVLYTVGKLKENDPLKGLTIHLNLNPVMME